MTPPLAHQLVTAEGRTPSAWIVFLHGLLGSGGNWRSFARLLLDRRPGLGAVLVDLRMHGRSRAAQPPHTLARAADDVAGLIGQLSAQGIAVRSLLGHSLGGKIALDLRARRLVSVDSTWIIDASPSARPEELEPSATNPVLAVIDFLAALPPSLASRDQLVARGQEAGIPSHIGRWLAMNLERAGGGYRLGIDLVAMRSLLDDYYRSDYWAAVEDREAPGRLHIVAADKSSALSQRDLERARAVASAAVELHTISGAGHWVHIDAPDRLADLVASDS